MTNRDISAIFQAIGSLLQIRDEDAFRSRIYERAADIIEEFPDELVSKDSQQNTPGYNREAVERLRATPGIGKAIEDKTVEMLETGRCKFYDELAAEMGTEILELLNLRGVGIKTVGRFYRELGIRNLEDLRVLIESGQLRRMKGIGRKTLRMITESLAFQEEQRNKRPLWRILPTAQDISNHLTLLINDGWIKRYQWTGDLRRHEEVCQSVELIVECEDEGTFRLESGVVPALLQAFLEPLNAIITPQNPIVFKTDSQIQYLYDRDSRSLIEDSQCEPTGDVRDTLPVIQFYIDRDFPVSVYLCTAATYEAILFLTTATDTHIDALSDNNFLNPTGFWHETRDMTEAEIYEKLGLSYIPAELRQDGASVIAAKEGALPTLVEFSDLRGDLHAHTNSSDGRHTLQDMVAAAKAEGLEYFAITDHSVSSTVANGLDRERLLEQVVRVRELDAEVEGITILAGSEVDIRRYGELDYPDEVLAQLDIVVASVHSHFTLSEAEMTQRIVRAIENPFVNIIGHPTGRLLGRRPMYPLNIEEIIEAAAENQTVLEINGSLSRLDLDPEFVRMAKKAGVLLAVNTDAHDIGLLARRQSGLNVARRGWLTKNEVINTYTLEELHEKCNIG
ncbi:MAG: PHP domain-containing protein [Candidatus Poribacteria bacterium]|nr:PHP domain-containing protein [Candidatus Poribacteria bacterium]